VGNLRNLRRFALTLVAARNEDTGLSRAGVRYAGIRGHHTRTKSASDGEVQSGGAPHFAGGARRDTVVKGAAVGLVELCCTLELSVHARAHAGIEGAACERLQRGRALDIAI